MPADLAQFLRQEMTRRGWTQEELARRIQVAPSAVSNMLVRETGLPRLDTLVRLSQALDVSIARLLTLCGISVQSSLSEEDEQLIDRMNDDCLLRATIEILVALPELYQRLMHHQAVYLWRLANQDADTVREKP